ncbi:MAG: hypothetical protein P4L79_10250 [Legionella sp.]|uniref:hypothetical protein n=1 Tax=Legionella sp. TaxID=459 RepID=UPI00284D6778|nr:hypothetical protein [Legionella sp.]
MKVYQVKVYGCTHGVYTTREKAIHYCKNYGSPNASCSVEEYELDDEFDLNKTTQVWCSWDKRYD